MNHCPVLQSIQTPLQGLSSPQSHQHLSAEYYQQTCQQGIQLLHPDNFKYIKQKHTLHLPELLQPPESEQYICDNPFQVCWIYIFI